MARVIAVYGPTASGKSAAALTLAGRLDAEIVNCDAMQLYARAAGADQPALA